MAKNRFSVNPPSWTGMLFRPIVFCILIAGITLGFPDISMGARNETDAQSVTANRIIRQNRSQTVLIAANENSEATPVVQEEKSTGNKNVERWKALPSDEKKELRKRMDQWRNLTPQEQEKYRRIHEKLQKMTPTQRKKVDQGLEKGDTLPPTEKEEIRKLFEE